MQSLFHHLIERNSWVIVFLMLQKGRLSIREVNKLLRGKTSQR